MGGRKGVRDTGRGVGGGVMEAKMGFEDALRDGSACKHFHADDDA